MLAGLVPHFQSKNYGPAVGDDVSHSDSPGNSKPLGFASGPRRPRFPAFGFGRTDHGLETLHDRTFLGFLFDLELDFPTLHAKLDQAVVDLKFHVGQYLFNQHQPDVFETRHPKLGGSEFDIVLAQTVLGRF